MSGDLREDKKDFTGWLLNQAFIEFIAGAQLQIHTIFENFGNARFIKPLPEEK